MTLTDCLDENKVRNTIEEYMKDLPPNGCTCPNCMRSWKKRREFDAIENKSEYFKNRKKNYEIDDLVFDTTKDISAGDMLFWTDIEKELHDKYRDTFGLMCQYFPMMDYGDMGKDVEYEPVISQEERGVNYVVDIDLIFANAISDNPKSFLMTRGEHKIYEKLRNKVYLNAQERILSIESYNRDTKDIFSF